MAQSNDYLRVMLASATCKKFIRITAAALLTCLSFFVILPVAGFTARIVCPLLGHFCSLSSLGGVFFTVGVLAIFGLVGALSVRAVLKIPLLVGSEVGITSVTSVILIMGSVSTVLQTDMPSYVGYIGIPLVFLISFMLHTLLFEKLSKKKIISVVVAIALVASYMFAVPFLLKDVLDGQRRAFEDSKELNEAKALKFQVYSPSYLPFGYALVGTNAYVATQDTSQSYSSTFSTRQGSYVGARNLFIDQVEFEAYSPPAVCDSKDISWNMRQLGECKKIGHTDNCDVYYQFPSIDDADDFRAFCKIGNTHLTLTAKISEISTDEVVKIFASMKLGNVETLQYEASKNDH